MIRVWKLTNWLILFENLTEIVSTTQSSNSKNLTLKLQPKVNKSKEKAEKTLPSGEKKLINRSSYLFATDIIA